MFGKSKRAYIVPLLLALLFSSSGAFPVHAAALPATLQFTPVASGLTDPMFITNAADGSNRLFILQQTGQIRVFKNGSLLPTPFLNLAGLIPAFTGANGEQGLLGLAFSTNYASSGIFYITYTTNTGNATFPYTTTLARYHVSGANPDVADPASGSVLLAIPKKYTNHNGGMLAFGPDHYLYMSMGDGGSGGDPDNNAQNLHTLLGKILRMDVTSTPAAGQKYVIPSTNPFYGSGDPAVRQEIWAYGVRNPWRFSFDRATGDLYIADVGQNIEEEVDFQASGSGGGQNYGWHILEGNLCYNPSTNCVPPSGYVAPVATYDHGTNDSYGCSITGGYVYRGNRFPSLQGVYFYGDFCSGKVLGLVKSGGSWSHSLISSTNFSISSFGEGEQGQLYLADYTGGKVYEVGSALVTISGNVGVAGASLAYVDGTSKSVTSLADGSYSISVPQGWSGTITPSLACYTFGPLNNSYTDVTGNLTGQDYTYTLDSGAGCTDVSVSIGTNPQRAYAIPSGGRIAPQYPVLSGPVKVVSTNANKFLTSERVHNKNGFVNEVMGVPNNQLTNEYWFPWYDNLTMQTWLLIGNPSTTNTAHVHVYIAGTLMDPPGTPPTGVAILPGQSWTPQFPVLSGPVHITSDINVFASERVHTSQGFVQETMGYPNNRLSSDYWFPWYDNLTMQTWLLVGNPSTTLTAHVHVYIAGNLMDPPGTPPAGVAIDPGKSWTPMFPVLNGPVKVTSDLPVFSSERVHNATGFVQETMGVPSSQFTNEYWFPWYDNLTMQTWLLVGNPSTSATAHVHIYIAGEDMNTAGYDIGPGSIVTPQFARLNGPVHIVSDSNVFTSERVHTAQGFVQETLGIPNTGLATEYWFPWYDNLSMSSWLLIAAP